MLRRTFISLLLGFSVITTASAATVEVDWHEPSSYRDIRPAEEPQERFQNRVFEHLSAYFETLAARLPESQKLQITVTDLDLAGEVYPENINNSLHMVRVVRSSDFPSITLSYTLTDANGTVLQEGEERLRGRDLPGQGRTSMRGRNTQQEALPYERAMLDRWFRFRFEQNQ